MLANKLPMLLPMLLPILLRRVVMAIRGSNPFHLECLLAKAWDHVSRQRTGGCRVNRGLFWKHSTFNPQPSTNLKPPKAREICETVDHSTASLLCRRPFACLINESMKY
jgi:hypothetical protein